jgi:hypothetical protein
MGAVGQLARARRLLAALAQFASEEGICLAEGRAGPALAAHRRAEPLLEEFIRTTSLGMARCLEPGLSAWLEKRRCNLDLARACSERLRAESERVRAAQGRLSRLAPVYRKRAARPARIHAAA